MATSQTARLTVTELASKGQPIPAGLALDREGQPTTDPQRALDGTVAPLGGHKGTGLALMVEILAAGLTGANWSHTVTPMALSEGPPFDSRYASCEPSGDQDGANRKWFAGAAWVR